MAAVGSEHFPARRDPSVVVPWALLGLVIVWYAFSSLRPERVAAPTCEPIAFTLVGSPPPFATSELAVAIQEIQERTGLLFETEPAGTGQSKLSISWRVDDTLNSGSAVVGAAGGMTRLGLGGAQWRNVPGGRELVAAVIEINGDVQWRGGLETDDGLAAVFVHELGHVVGLPHHPDPASFMHHRPSGERPAWTEAEAAELAWFGQRSGCQPPIAFRAVPRQEPW